MEAVIGGVVVVIRIAHGRRVTDRRRRIGCHINIQSDGWKVGAIGDRAGDDQIAIARIDLLSRAHRAIVMLRTEKTARCRCG